MNPPPDGDDVRADELGAQLDSYLSARRDREDEPARSSPPEIAPLEDVIDRLDDLATAVNAQPEPTADLPTHIGKFVIKRALGRGGQSLVLLAFDPDLERHVVVKVYHQATTATQRERILNEGRALARINSLHVATCYGVDRDNDRPYLIMEHVDGQPLSELLSGESRIPLKRCLEITSAVVAGLTAIHSSGLVHRDVKPGNIIVGVSGTPKLIDFGLSEAMAREWSGRSAGTLGYMAPERLSGDVERVDARSDLFSVGAVMYEFLAGVAPFRRETREETLRAVQADEVAPPCDLNPDVPAAISNLCMRCLSKSPSERPRDAAEVYAVLREYAQPKSRRVRRHLILGTAGAIVTAAFVAAMFSPSTNSPYDAKWAEVARAFSSTLDVDPEQLLHLDNGLELELRVVEHPDDEADGVFQMVLGESVHLGITAAADCYIAAYSVEFQRGRELPKDVHLLFPDPGQDNRVVAGRPIKIGPFEARAASGLELIYVIGATTPWDPHSTIGSFDVTGSDSDRSRWTRKLRALRRQRTPSELFVRYNVQPP